MTIDIANISIKSKWKDIKDVKSNKLVDINTLKSGKNELQNEIKKYLKLYLTG